VCRSTLEYSSKVYFAFFGGCISSPRHFRSLQQLLEYLKENKKLETGAQCWADHSAQGLAGSARPGPAHGLGAGVRMPGACVVQSAHVVRAQWCACRWPDGARPMTRSSRGGVRHGGGMGDSPLGRHDGEGGGDDIRRRRVASGGR
jgi:hypothetical protein